jgi:hypothetical protein
MILTNRTEGETPMYSETLETWDAIITANII